MGNRFTSIVALFSLLLPVSVTLAGNTVDHVFVCRRIFPKSTPQHFNPEGETVPATAGAYAIDQSSKITEVRFSTTSDREIVLGYAQPGFDKYISQIHSIIFDNKSDAQRFKTLMETGPRMVLVTEHCFDPVNQTQGLPIDSAWPEQVTIHRADQGIEYSVDLYEYVTGKPYHGIVQYMGTAFDAVSALFSPSDKRVQQVRDRLIKGEGASVTETNSNYAPDELPIAAKENKSSESLR